MALSAAAREKLIQQYAEGPTRLKAALATVPPAALHWRPAPAEWSAHEVVCHCADSEMNAAARIRYLVAEKEPVIIGYDQDVWARTLDYAHHPIEPALATVEAVRANTTALIRHLPESAWSRSGHHSESGPYGAEDWLALYAEHLEIHARQIEAAVSAWRSQGGAPTP
jgi:hypothetical protein